MPRSSTWRGGRPSIGASLNEIEPSRGFSRPLIALSTVDLPAPLGPMMQVIVPDSSRRSTPLRMSPEP